MREQLGRAATRDELEVEPEELLGERRDARLVEDGEAGMDKPEGGQG